MNTYRRRILESKLESLVKRQVKHILNEENKNELDNRL